YQQRDRPDVADVHTEFEYRRRAGIQQAALRRIPRHADCGSESAALPAVWDHPHSLRAIGEYLVRRPADEAYETVLAWPGSHRGFHLVEIADPGRRVRYRRRYHQRRLQSRQPEGPLRQRPAARP